MNIQITIEMDEEATDLTQRFIEALETMVELKDEEIGLTLRAPEEDEGENENSAPD